MNIKKLFLSLMLSSSFICVIAMEESAWEVHNSKRSEGEQFQKEQAENEARVKNQETMITQHENTSLLKAICLKNHPMGYYCDRIETMLYCAHITSKAQKSFCEHALSMANDAAYYIVKLGEENKWSPRQTTREIELLAKTMQKLQNQK